MGDRTYTWTTVSAGDLPGVKDLLLGPEWREGRTRFGFEDETAGEDGTVTFGQRDVNWGGESDAEALQAAGIPFLIHHHNGYSYPEGYVACDGASRCSVASSDGMLLVEFDERTGGVGSASLERARDFVLIRELAFKRMRERARPATGVDLARLAVRQR